uniref:Protein MAIN-LIKE 1-like n=1 Tax=Cicer arietinum TaxID=3827 RepID=A0A3Q7Y3K2_CICAR|nr:protein MAIN-LIKE 1-like [Cicer arietinum]
MEIGSEGGAIETIRLNCILHNTISQLLLSCQKLAVQEFFFFFSIEESANSINDLGVFKVTISETWDRGSLKVITHGLKLKKFAEVPMPAPVEHWIQESGLMHLSSDYLTMADGGLISAFVERWHRETNSFHLPFGEMTITLDDVATLLHISPHGKIFDAPLNMNTNNAVRAAHEYLGATWEEACAEISYNKCAQYRLQWLRDLYSRLIQTNQFECAARTYLLHLVGCTIFADKTHTRVEAKYISLFIDLHRCRDYSWASAALVFLYDNLGDGAIHDTRQLGGYMSLLQISATLPTHKHMVIHELF